MIKINSDEKVIISINEVEYCLKEKEQYKKFVIMLTDPINAFDTDNLKVDETIEDPRLRSICEKYKQFFTSYLDGKEEVINKAKLDFAKKKDEIEESLN